MKSAFSRLLKKAHLRRYVSALAAHVPIKYAPLLDPRDALQLNLFEQPAKQGVFQHPVLRLFIRKGQNLL